MLKNISLNLIERKEDGYNRKLIKKKQIKIENNQRRKSLLKGRYNKVLICYYIVLNVSLRLRIDLFYLK